MENIFFLRYAFRQKLIFSSEFHIEKEICCDCIYINKISIFFHYIIYSFKFAYTYYKMSCKFNEVLILECLSLNISVRFVNLKSQCGKLVAVIKFVIQKILNGIHFTKTIIYFSVFMYVRLKLVCCVPNKDFFCIVININLNSVVTQ